MKAALWLLMKPDLWKKTPLADLDAISAAIEAASDVPSNAGIKPASLIFYFFRLFFLKGEYMMMVHHHNV